MPTPTISKRLKAEIREGLLKYCLRSGRENALTGQTMARMLDLPDDRKIRLVIRELIHEGYPIASAVSGSPKGYFIVKNTQEATDYIVAMTARIREDAKRLEDFRRAAKLKGARCGQLPLL